MTQWFPRLCEAGVGSRLGWRTSFGSWNPRCGKPGRIGEAVEGRWNRILNVKRMGLQKSIVRVAIVVLMVLAVLPAMAGTASSLYKHGQDEEARQDLRICIRLLPACL